MGLDMYLRRKRYIGAKYDFNKITGEITLQRNGEPIKINLNKVSEIVEEAGYWRKANAIHKWFVHNVQEGEDDCGDYYVSREQLEELLAICKKIRKNPKLAEDLLPTQSGFFFGNTEYNEDYLAYIKDTIKILEEALKDDEGDFYYQSSW